MSNCQVTRDDYLRGLGNPILDDFMDEDEFDTPYQHHCAAFDVEDLKGTLRRIYEEHAPYFRFDDVVEFCVTLDIFAPQEPEKRDAIFAFDIAGYLGALSADHESV